MKSNIREYQTIKFFRGSKRKNEEMQKLSDAKLDFEYRRLLIEENELDMHVAFSKMKVYGWLSWSFIVLTIAFIHTPIVIFALIGLAVISRFFSFINERYFRFILRSHNIALGFVNGVIFDNYGISLE